MTTETEEEQRIEWRAWDSLFIDNDTMEAYEEEEAAAIISRLIKRRDDLLLKYEAAGRYTVVWTNAEKNVWFTTRVQDVADGAAAVLAVKLDAAGELHVINVFQGWPAEADDDDDLEGLSD